jgi:tRNA(Ile)-lysidine synthase
MDLKDFLQFTDKQKLFFPGEKILLAVSGGMDSTVMTDLFRRAKFPFAIAHCNFGLRGKESDGDEVFVRRMADELKVAFFSEKFSTAEFASKNGISVQMAARELRYEWFEKVRAQQGFDHIATAHHLDDQVETFLINMIRGTGISGLHGIPIKNGKVIRPLLFAYRKDIVQYALDHKIRHREDHSNQETKYLRNKIRHEVVPMLCSINPEFSEGLSETIRRIREFEELGDWALKEWKDRVMKRAGNDVVIMIEHLLKSTPLSVMPWELLSPFGFNESQVRNAMDCLEKDGEKMFLSSTHSLVKDRGRLVISPIRKATRNRRIKINPFVRKKSIREPLPMVLERINDPGTYEIPADETIASLDYNKLVFPLIIRPWRPGDSFMPLGMRKKKKLSDFFIDRKFSSKKKENTWLLCSGKDIVWIIGHRIDHRYRITPQTREILRVVL